MSRQLERGRLVVTRWGADGATVESGAIYIEDGIVREIGHFGALQRRHPDAEPIGDGTHVVMPGFVNAHSHGRGITTLRQGIPDEPGEVRSVGLRLGLCDRRPTFPWTLSCCARSLLIARAKSRCPGFDPSTRSGALSRSSAMA